MLRNHWYLRFRTIAAENDGGGSDDESAEESQSENNGNSSENPDWHAKYEEMQKHSRTWEERAKANKAAADELEKLKTSQMSAEEKAAQLQQKLDAIEAEKQQNDWKAEAAKATGVPASVLRGSTQEEITEHANALKSLLSPEPPKGPEVPDPFKQPQGHKAKPLGEFARKVFGNK